MRCVREAKLASDDHGAGCGTYLGSTSAAWLVFGSASRSFSELPGIHMDLGLYGPNTAKAVLISHADFACGHDNLTRSRGMQSW